MIIPSRNKKRIRELHAEYEKTALPVTEQVAIAAAGVLLEAGIDPETLSKHAQQIGDAVVALACLPPAIRAQVPTLAQLVAPLDPLPAHLRRYAISYGRAGLNEYGWQQDLPRLAQQSAAAPKSNATQQAKQAASDKLIAEQRLIDDETMCAKLGLGELEWRQFTYEHRTYYNMAPPPAVLLPDGRRMWQGDFNLSAEDRAQLAKATTLTRHQAAELLGVSLAKFDALKKRAGLRHASSFRSASGYAGYLYALADVVKLKG